MVLVSSLIIAGKGLGLLGIVVLLMKYVIPRLARRLAHSQELLILFAIAWAVLLGAGSELLGFSKEVGAFLAGVSLVSTGYREAIGSRLTSLRDFLLLFFFIALGARLDLSNEKRTGSWRCSSGGGIGISNAILAPAPPEHNP